MSAKIHLMGTGPRGGRVYYFHCPGCDYGHPFEVGGKDCWTWNGSLDRPTFAPSLLVWGSRPAARCHLFLRDGKIEFQRDCHHSLAGQTVECPDWDDA